MSDIIPTLIYALAIGYASIGTCVAVTFLLFGLDRLVPLARGAYAFRPLLVPGLVLLWPIVAIRWSRHTQRRG